jgi:YtkA-like
MIKTLCLVAALLSLWPPLAAQTHRPQVDLRCEAHGLGPMLDCRVQLKGPQGEPMTGASVTLGATMPSMPMAHSVRPVKTAPGAAPGEYRGELALEMGGVWAVEIDIAGPVRDRVVRVLMATECADNGRCPAPPARAAAEPRKH